MQLSDFLDEFAHGHTDLGEALQTIADTLRATGSGGDDWLTVHTGDGFLDLRNVPVLAQFTADGICFAVVWEYDGRASFSCNNVLLVVETATRPGEYLPLLRLSFDDGVLWRWILSREHVKALPEEIFSSLHAFENATGRHWVIKTKHAATQLVVEENPDKEED